MGYVYLVIVLAVATCHVWGLALAGLQAFLAQRRASRRAGRAWGVGPASWRGVRR